MSDEAPIQFEFIDGSSEASIEDLQNQIITCTIPSSGDGITNAWRTYYICDVFEVQNLDLTQTMPYSAMMGCKDLDKVTASVHLAKLQFQFNEAARVMGFIDDEGADFIACYLHHMLRLMTHHLSHLKRGKPTPPIGFQ